LTLKLAEALEQLLRGLSEITNLTVRLHPDSDDVTITIRLPADELYQIADTAERITTMTAPDVAGVERLFGWVGWGSCASLVVRALLTLRVGWLVASG
jgi:hypothetical protein